MHYRFKHWFNNITVITHIFVWCQLLRSVFCEFLNVGYILTSPVSTLFWIRILAFKNVVKIFFCFGKGPTADFIKLESFSPKDDRYLFHTQVIPPY